MYVFPTTQRYPDTNVFQDLGLLREIPYVKRTLNGEGQVCLLDFMSSYRRTAIPRRRFSQLGFLNFYLKPICKAEMWDLEKHHNLAAYKI